MRGETIEKAARRGQIPLGDVRVDCFNLEDGRRVVSMRGAVRAIAGKETGRLDSYLRPAVLHRGRHATTKGRGTTTPKSGAIGAKGRENTMVPEPIEAARIKFYSEGTLVEGIEAMAFIGLCETVMNAGLAGRLRTKRQLEVAQRCGVIVGACSRVGITALIDEATDAQASREKGALARIVDLYVQKNLRAAARRLPPEWWKLHFELRRWKVPDDCVGAPRGPRVISHDLRTVLYLRLPAGVLPALEALNPTNDRYRRRHKLHQHLTDAAIAEFELLVQRALTLMRAAVDWKHFLRLLDKAMPLPGAQSELPIDFREGAEAVPATKRKEGR